MNRIAARRKCNRVSAQKSREKKKQETQEIFQVGIVIHLLNIQSYSVIFKEISQNHSCLYKCWKKNVISLFVYFVINKKKYTCSCIIQK